MGDDDILDGRIENDGEPSRLQPASNTPRTDRFAPKPPGERRARQTEVEQLYVFGVPPMRIAERMSKKYEVSTRVIHSDMRRVRRRWDAEDARRGNVRRQRQVRALEDLALRCRQAEDRDGERQTRFAIGRLLGMGRADAEPERPQTLVFHIGLPKVLTCDDRTLRPALPADGDVRVVPESRLPREQSFVSPATAPTATDSSTRAGWPDDGGGA